MLYKIARNTEEKKTINLKYNLIIIPNSGPGNAGNVGIEM